MIPARWLLHSAVTIALLPSWPQSFALDLELDTPTSGEITDEDGELWTSALDRVGERAVRCQTFTLSVAEPDTYHIELRSHYFDTYLVLRDESDPILAQDNDGLLRTHSRIVAKLEPGRYRVIAAALQGGSGPFLIQVRRGRPGDRDAASLHTAAVEDARDELVERESTLGTDHARTGESLDGLGSLLWSDGQYAAAESCMRRALDIARASFGDDDPRTAYAFFQLTLQVRGQGRDTGAEGLEQQLQDSLAAAVGSAPSETARLRHLLVALLREGARTQYARALAAYESRRPADDLERANDFRELAYLFSNQGIHGEAATLFERAARLREEQLGSDHPDVCRDLSELARLRQASGDHDGAKRDLERAFLIAETHFGSEGPSSTPAVQSLLGVLLSVAETLVNGGDYDEARSIYDRALRFYEARYGPDHASTTSIVTKLADLLKAQGDYAVAQRLYERVVATYEGQYGADSVYTAFALTNLGAVLVDRGDHEQARSLFEGALEVVEVQLGADHPATMSVEVNLANLLNKQGHWGEALPLLEDALRLCEALYGPDHAATGAILFQLSTLKRDEGKYDEARPLHERALAIFEDKLGPTHQGTLGALLSLARLVHLQGDHDEAHSLYERAFEIRHRLLTDLAPTLSEREFLLWLGQQRFGLDSYLELRDGPSARDAYAKVLGFKGAVSRQLEQLHAQRQRGAGPEIAALARRLREVVARLSSDFSDGPAAGGKNDHGLLVREKEDLERRLAQRTASLLTRPAADVDALERALGEADALVDLFTYGTGGARNVVGFVIRPGQQVRRIELGPRASVRQAVRRHLGQLRGVEPLKEAEVSSIRELLWTPLMAHLGGVRRVFVSPAGALATLPFETLPGAKDGTYLIEEYSFVYLQSAGDLGRDHRTSLGSGALIIGGVDYASARADTAGSARPTVDGASELRGSLKHRWRPLPATRGEAEELGFYFTETHEDEGVSLLLGDAATEERLQAEVGSKRYVHLATHGYFAPEYMVSLNDAARRAAEDDGGVALEDRRTHLAGWMPGLLSGVVLAGANGRTGQGHDGILTASEALWLDLEACELFTLSACETGLGVERDGEHLIGLRRALQLAGARTTITSLWKVDDQATQELMQGMYERLWIGGESKSDALRNAQLSMLRKNRAAHGEGLPRTWGAFVLEGDWR